VIDLFGKGSFLRSWLPLALLAILVAALFPPCWPRRGEDARAPWEGVVILATVEPPPTEPLRLLVTVALRDGPAGRAERLVVGEAVFPPAAGPAASPSARPILLAAPRGELGAQLVRRVPPRGVGGEGATVTIALHRARDLERIDSAVGALLRTGEITAAPGTLPLPPPILELPLEVDLDPSRHRRWPGSAERFTEEWARLRDEIPGGLTPYIHARLTLRSDAPPVGG